ncbi:MAG: hypothetical protein HJJLKODD_01026 [Phycisphaerae bacterium]|nr:hypothetical protein [Phycisphaerae bacterium]
MQPDFSLAKLDRLYPTCRIYLLLTLLVSISGCQTTAQSSTTESATASNEPHLVYQVEVPAKWPEKEPLPNYESVQKPPRYLYPKNDYARRHRQGWDDCVADVLTGAVIRNDAVLEDRFHGYDAEEAGYRDGYRQARRQIDQLFGRYDELAVLKLLEKIRSESTEPQPTG